MSDLILHLGMQQDLGESIEVGVCLSAECKNLYKNSYMYFIFNSHSNSISPACQRFILFTCAVACSLMCGYRDRRSGGCGGH